MQEVVENFCLQCICVFQSTIFIIVASITENSIFTVTTSLD